MRELMRWIPNRRNSALGRLVIQSESLSSLVLRYERLDTDSEVLYSIVYSDSYPQEGDFDTDLLPSLDETIVVDKTQGRYAAILAQFDNPANDDFVAARIVVSGFQIKIDVLNDDAPVIEFGYGYLVEVGIEEYELTASRGLATHAFIDVGVGEWEIVPIEDFDGTVLLRVLANDTYQGV